MGATTSKRSEEHPLPTESRPHRGVSCLAAFGPNLQENRRGAHQRSDVRFPHSTIWRLPFRSRAIADTSKSAMMCP